MEIDFGLLNEACQRQVLHRLIREPAGRQTLKVLNPVLEALAEEEATSRETIRRNRRIVLSDYSADTYQEALRGVYRRVMAGEVSHGIRKECLLSRFLDLERLSLLKWGTYESMP